MEKNKEELMEQMEEIYQELPTKWKIAIGWMVKNWGFVEKICKDTTMTNEELEGIIEEARTRGDASMEILCRLAMYFKEQKSEQNSRTDNPKGGMMG